MNGLLVLLSLKMVCGFSLNDKQDPPIEEESQGFLSISSIVSLAEDIVDVATGDYCEVRLYQHTNFNGWKATFDAGEYTKTDLEANGAPANAVSSLRVVGPTCQAILFDYSNFGGWAAPFGEGEYNSVSDLSAHGAINDDTESLVVRKTEFTWTVRLGEEVHGHAEFESGHNCQRQHGQCYWTRLDIAMANCESWSVCTALFCTDETYVTGGQYRCYARNFHNTIDSRSGSTSYIKTQKTGDDDVSSYLGSTVWKNNHCGGKRLDQLSDGTSTGQPGEVLDCQRKCVADFKCSAFMFKHSDKTCHWRERSDTLEITGNQAYDCYTQSEYGEPSESIDALQGELLWPMVPQGNYIIADPEGALSSGGEATFLVEALTDSVITFEFEVSATNGQNANSDSFFLWFDETWDVSPNGFIPFSYSKYAWHMGDQASFSYRRPSETWFLPRGAHRLHVGRREAGAKMRNLRIVGGDAVFRPHEKPFTVSKDQQCDRTALSSLLVDGTPTGYEAIAGDVRDCERKCRSDPDCSSFDFKQSDSTCYWRNFESNCAVKYEEDVCCLDSCGTCGGAGCSGRPGGAANCCSSHVRNSGRFCDTHSEPCVQREGYDCYTKPADGPSVKQWQTVQFGNGDCTETFADVAYWWGWLNHTTCKELCRSPVNLDIAWVDAYSNPHREHWNQCNTIVYRPRTPEIAFPACKMKYCIPGDSNGHDEVDAENVHERLVDWHP